MSETRLERLSSVAVAVAAIAFASVLVHREFFTKDAAPDPVGPPQFVDEWRSFEASGRTIGESSAPIRVIEFSDLQCPACKRFNQVLHNVEAKYPGKIASVFVHFPLTSIHPLAVAAARMAECSAGEGRFAEMVDSIYRKQDSLGIKHEMSFALDARIRDTARYGRCFSDTSRVKMLDAGIALGKRINVHSTPTIVVNGWRFPSSPDEAVLSGTIDSLLAGRSPVGSTSLIDRLRSRQ